MSQDETKKPTDADVELEEADPVESIFTYASKNWKELAAALIIAAVIVVSVSIYQKRAAESREQAFNQLAAATTSSQFSEIIRQFPSTKAAEMATFMEARALYDAGNFGDANKLYEDFIKANPKHYLVAGAKLGQAHCQEGMGQLDEALAGFRQFVKDYPAETAFVTLARIGEARCLRQQGKIQDAVAVYESILLEQPQSDWKPLVEDLKATASRDLERAGKPAVQAKPAA
jgi:predicted negative regulator of RcsB-dependent stress response